MATSFTTCVASSLKVYVPSRIYFGGDILEGIITLDISQPIDSSGISLSLRGIESTKVKFVEKERPPSKEEHTFLSTSKRYTVTPPEGCAGIPPGKYHFAFAFKLPPKLPASLKNDEAEVKYELKANADIQPLFSLHDDIALNVGGNVFDDHEFNSDETTVFKENQKDVFWRGTVHAEATLPKSNWYIEEEVPILVEIENRSGHLVRGIRVEIKCEQTCIANSKSAVTTHRFKKLQNFEVPVLKFSSRKETLKFKVPAITPTTFPLTGCNKNITCNYWLILIFDIKNAPDFEILLPVKLIRRNPHKNVRRPDNVTCSRCQTKIESFCYKCDLCAASLCYECYQIRPSVHPEHTKFAEVSCIPESQIEEVTYVDMVRDTTNKVLQQLYPVGNKVKQFAKIIECVALLVDDSD